jgi:hypothetical protein
MKNNYSDRYFLVLYFHHFLVDSVRGYFVQKNNGHFEIHHQVIEFDGDPLENEASVLEFSIPEDAYRDVETLRSIALHLPKRSGGFDGRMRFLQSTVITESEFNAELESEDKRKETIREKAKANRNAVIDQLEKEGYHPLPSDANEFTWTAGCKFHGGKHFMFIDTRTNICSCPYGGKREKLGE